MVTSLDAESRSPQQLYEQLYCGRGEAENRIKEQLSLFSDHMSAETLRASSLQAKCFCFRAMAGRALVPVAIFLSRPTFATGC